MIVDLHVNLEKTSFSSTNDYYQVLKFSYSLLMSIYYFTSSKLETYFFNFHTSLRSENDFFATGERISGAGGVINGSSTEIYL